MTRRAARGNPNDLRPGDVFDLWTVTGAFWRREDGQALVPVRCDCGTEKAILFRSLGVSSSSCGCLQRAVASRPRKHGGAHVGREEPTYKVWAGMKRRCYGISFKQYADYGGRGIVVCDEWRGDYAAFRAWALASGYADHLDIDRVDNDGPYAPDNCRWVTRSQNLRNRRNNHLETAWGETKTMADWVDDARCTVSKATLASRVRYGWHFEDALTQPAVRPAV